MATLRDISKRIKAVQNTQKITRAMKMVAAAKFRKVQSRMFELRPYAEKMADVLTNLARGVEKESHPLLTVRPRKTVEVIVISADRGLCGAFNTNILKAAQDFIDNHKKEGFDVSISTVGKKGMDYFKRRDIPLRKTWTGISGSVIFSDVLEIADDIKISYIDGLLDEVTIIYNEFKTMVTQKVTTQRLLPLAPIEDAGEGEGAEESIAQDFIYEPSKEDILSNLIPKNVDIQLYRALLESSASEEAARMSAMENATQNCDEMVGKLTLQFNKARQAGITGELMDIVGGVEALKG
ncbi:MAG: ATP synthase F1 subunit gamma [Nitrospiraceae bacterium]|nr:MAG: ATP synthase F1 subunit gamma [Nitrospiraceae bacterium]